MKNKLLIATGFVSILLSSISFASIGIVAYGRHTLNVRGVNDNPASNNVYRLDGVPQMGAWWSISRGSYSTYSSSLTTINGPLQNMNNVLANSLVGTTKEYSFIVPDKLTIEGDVTWHYRTGSIFANLKVYDAGGTTLIRTVPCKLNNEFAVGRSIYIHFSPNNCNIDPY